MKILRMFEEDDETDGVVLIGEIGGTKEQEAAEFIASDFTKPVVGLIVGRSAPPGKRMGHAGAIITGSAGRASEKVKALSAAGVTVAPSPGAIGSSGARGDGLAAHRHTGESRYPEIPDWGNRLMQPVPDIMDLIARAPWRESVTYRDTWPHRVRGNQEGRSTGAAGRLLRAHRTGRGRGVPVLPPEAPLPLPG